MQFGIRKQTILSDNRNNRTIVKTGSPIAYLGIVGAAKLTSDFPAPRFGDDTRAYMQHIRGEADQLHEDIIKDAKRSEVNDCLLKIEESGELIDARKALICAGIKDPSDSQIKEFGAKYNAYKAAGKSIVRDTLAQFAKEVASTDKSVENRVHTTPEFRQAFSWWLQDYTKFENEHQTDLPGYRPTKEELDTWYAQLNGKDGWYDKAGKLGVTTNRPKPPSPKDVQSIPTWVWFAGIGVVLIIVTPSIITAIATAKAIGVR